MPAARLIVWDDAACWRVHEATLALLEETGVEVRHAGAREQLAEAGARVEGTRARIPAALVDAALQSAPRHFKLRERGASGGEGHARRGELGGLELEDGKSYFGTGSDCVYVTDPDTGERRRSTTADVEGMAALAEKLPNLDFVMSMGLPDDVRGRDRRPRPVRRHAGRHAQAAADDGARRSLPAPHEGHGRHVRRGAQLRLLRDAQPAAHPLRARRWTRSAPAPSSTSRSIYAPAPAAGTTAPASMTATIVDRQRRDAERPRRPPAHAERRAVRVRRRLRRLRHAHRRRRVRRARALPRQRRRDRPGALLRPAELRLRRRWPTPRASTSSGPPRPASPRCSARSAAPRCCTTSATSRAACRAATRRSSSATSWWATPARCSSRWASTTRRWR